MDGKDQRNASDRNLPIDDLVHYADIVLQIMLPGNVPGVVNTLVSDGIISKGLTSVTTCLGLSVFFMDYVSQSYFCTKFFSKSMYTACKRVHLYYITI